MTNTYLIVQNNIKNKINTIRGTQVMLDSDLAELYNVKTKILNQAVKRNNDRFPLNFMFQLSNAEFENLKLQIATSNIKDLRSQNVTLKRGIIIIREIRIKITDKKNDKNNRHS